LPPFSASYENPNFFSPATRYSLLLRTTTTHSLQATRYPRWLLPPPAMRSETLEVLTMTLKLARNVALTLLIFSAIVHP
jgi:hypothetical protein